MGAGDALGGAIARRFAREGLIAVPSRRKIMPLGELVAEIEADGCLAEGIPCDARDEEAVINLFDKVENEIGPVEAFVFNTGAQHSDSILDMTAKIYRQVWESAAFAGFLTGREAARRMVGPRPGNSHLYRRDRKCARRGRLCVICGRETRIAGACPIHGA